MLMIDLQIIIKNYENLRNENEKTFLVEFDNSILLLFYRH